MDIDTSALFAPIVINGHTVKNRLSVAPMTRITATQDGRATETMTRYYERFARGGFGTVITEGIYTDQAFSQGYAHQPGMTDEAQANAWKPVVSGIKAHGALAIAQMMHAGAISQGNRFRDTHGGAVCHPAEGRADDLLSRQGPLRSAGRDDGSADRRRHRRLCRVGGARHRGCRVRRHRNPRRQRISARPVFDRLRQHQSGSLGRRHGEPRAIDPRNLQGGAGEGRRQGAGRRPHLARQGERLSSQVGRCGARCRNHLRQPRGRRRRLHPCDRIRGVEAGISPRAVHP